MTPEQLMIPRYKVIADYPKSFYTLGQVIECDEPDHQLAQWPAIFKPLQWWEVRKKEELPQYLRRTDYVIKVDNHQCTHDFHGRVVSEPSMFISNDCVAPQPYWAWQPATESEYTTYINSKK